MSEAREMDSCCEDYTKALAALATERARADAAEAERDRLREALHQHAVRLASTSCEREWDSGWQFVCHICRASSPPVGSMMETKREDVRHRSDCLLAAALAAAPAPHAPPARQEEAQESDHV